MSPKHDLNESIDSLPPRQREVFLAIQSFLDEFGYPPSIQQLCELCGVSSTSTIHYHVTTLKKKGFILGPEGDESRSQSRSMTLREDLVSQRGKLPMLGTIAAGQPLTVADVADAVDELDLAQDVCPEGCYALRVRGESMIEDHIMDGDIVIVNPGARTRDGDVVVALVDGHTATLKRIYKDPKGIRLQPANASMEPIYVTEVEVQGKVEAVLRKV